MWIKFPWVTVNGFSYFFSHFLQDGRLNNFDPRGYLWDGVDGWMALFWVACARLSDCKEVKGGSAWSRKLSHQVLRSLDVIRELKQGRFSTTNVNRRWGLSFFINATKFVSLSFFQPKIWAKLLPKNAESPLSADVLTFKGCVVYWKKTGEKSDIVQMNTGRDNYWTWTRVSRELREISNLVQRALFHSSPGAIRSTRGP